MRDAASDPAAGLRDQPHRRFDLLSGSWILVSPHRAARPWQGAVEGTPPPESAAHDPSCYLCPGNRRATGARNPDYTGTYVFDNDFAALRPGDAEVALDDEGLLVARREMGRCRVVCFSPRHDLTLARMTPEAVRDVVETWAAQYTELGALPGIGHVQIFENTGAMMGCSNPHPHGQIWAQQSVPEAVAREGVRLRAHHEGHGRTLLDDYLATELARSERVVYENAHVVVLVPFWASWPFETLVLPRRPARDVSMLDDAQRDALADAMRRLTRGYDALFDAPFPYSAGLHQAPTDGRPHPEWHLHLHFYPPLLRSASVRKFMVGYEMLAEPQRDITPESAADRLRAAIERSA